MNIKNFVSVLLLFITFNSFSQDNLFSFLTIDPELKENANAVIRSHDIVIELHSYDNMTIKIKRAITIYNKNGLRHLNPYLYYDPEIRVKSINAFVYNSFGNEIKKFKKKDFKDYSNSGNDLFSDNRVLALDYTPISYPFTFVFETETQTNSTAFFPRWYPVQGYFISAENSSFKIINHENVPLDIKKFNLDGDGIENLSNGNIIHFKAKNLKAYKWESMSPAFNKFAPVVKFAPRKFRLVDVDGHAENWNDFGKWNYDVLLKGRNDLPESAKLEIADLVQGIKDPIEKAKIIYQYVQDKTRYISIQLGVGGWQPMLASKVDEVSYGDCKALTNYTKALMDSQGISSYYSIVVRNQDLEDIESEFVAMQGNHVFLKIPNDDEPFWLECTSQKVPFGHIANSTDDRDVLVITPEGGRIEHTKVYTSQESYLKTTADVSINDQGGILAKVTSKSGGVQYDDRLRSIVDSDQKDRDTHYKDYWSHINGLSLDKIKIDNNRDRIEITEEIDLKAPTYTTSIGEKLLISPNMFNRFTSLPPRYSTRKLPFVIQRGFYDEDEYIINLTNNLSFETLIQDKEIKTQFGIYKVAMEKLSDTKIRYKRSLEIFKGDYQKEDYNTYRSFMRKVAKADKASFVLNKIN